MNTKKIIILGLFAIGCFYFIKLIFGDCLGSDAVTRIAYWNLIINGKIHTAPFLSSPKPLVLVLFGVIYRIFSSYGPIMLITFISSALVVILALNLYKNLFGKQAIFVILLFFILLVNKNTLISTILANGRTYTTLFLFSALTSAIFVKHKKVLCTSLFLILAGLVKAEAWFISFPLILFLLYEERRIFSIRTFLYMVLLLVSPLLWLYFDYLVKGDSMYSFEGAQTYLYPYIIPGYKKMPLWGYMPWVWKGVLEYVPNTLLPFFIIGLLKIIKEKKREVIIIGIMVLMQIFFYFIAAALGMCTWQDYLFFTYIMIIVISIGGISLCFGAFNNFVREFINRFIRLSQPLRKAFISGIICVEFLILLSPFLLHTKELYYYFQKISRKNRNTKLASTVISKDTHYAVSSKILGNNPGLMSLILKKSLNDITDYKEYHLTNKGKEDLGKFDYIAYQSPFYAERLGFLSDVKIYKFKRFELHPIFQNAEDGLYVYKVKKK